MICLLLLHIKRVAYCSTHKLIILLKIMNKPILLIFYIIFWMSTIYSQQNTFSRVLTCNNTNNMIYAVQASYEDGYIMVGSKQNQGIILKIDPEGNVIWNKEIGDPNTNLYPCIVLNDIIGTVDSCYFIAGSVCHVNGESYQINSLCMKINGMGDILWSKDYNYNNPSEFTNVCQVKDSGYVLIGRINFYEKILVSKINSSGELEWSKILQAGNNSNIAKSIKEYEDSSYVVTGYFENGPPFTFHPYVLRISSDGTISSAKEYLSNAMEQCVINDVEFSSDGLVYHWSNSAGTGIFKTDAKGNFLWNKMYSTLRTQLLDFTSPKIHRTHDKSYIIVGKLGTDYGSVVKIDSTGNAIWQKELVVDPADVIETKNNEFFIPGNTVVVAYPKNTTRSDYPGIGLIQIDSLGNGKECVQAISNSSFTFTLDPDTAIFSVYDGGTTENSISLDVNSENIYSIQEGCAFNSYAGVIDNNYLNTINIYPNPSMGIFNIHIGDHEDAKLIVYNSKGEKIYDSAIYSEDYVCDLSKQPDGIYFFKIIFSSDKYFYKKLTIRKE